MSEVSVQCPFSIGRQRKRARYTANYSVKPWQAPVKISASELHLAGNGTCRREGTFLSNPFIEHFLGKIENSGKSADVSADELPARRLMYFIDYFVPITLLPFL